MWCCSVELYAHLLFYFFFFFNDTATTEIYTLSLHDALPICRTAQVAVALTDKEDDHAGPGEPHHPSARDRKSTRLNSSHSQISYAVFCLKKKKKKQIPIQAPDTTNTNNAYII